jgi:hypothetical protein
MNGEVRGKRGFEICEKSSIKRNFNDQYINNSSPPLCNVVMHMSAPFDS